MFPTVRPRRACFHLIDHPDRIHRVRNGFAFCVDPARRGETRFALDIPVEDTPFIALVDDDGHSAQLLERLLLAHGAPEVRHFASAQAGEAALAAMLADIGQQWPGLVVVDLKSYSGANAEFVARNHGMLRQKGIPLVVMTQPTDREGRQRLHDVGASAVFFRQADRDAYRREAAAIVSFWARNQRLDAVGM